MLPPQRRYAPWFNHSGVELDVTLIVLADHGARALVSPALAPPASSRCAGRTVAAAANGNKKAAITTTTACDRFFFERQSRIDAVPPDRVVSECPSTGINAR
jgi:hypothetical protein